MNGRTSRQSSEVIRTDRTYARLMSANCGINLHESTRVLSERTFVLSVYPSLVSEQTGRYSRDMFTRVYKETGLRGARCTA